MAGSWTEITSAQNPKIKDVAKLRIERQRKKQKRIVIDGVREIRRAAVGGFEFESFFLCQETQFASVDHEFLSSINAVNYHRLPKAVFEKIAFGDRNEGVVAVALEKQTRLSQLELGESPLILVLDGIEKPGNVGAVFRTASAAGVTAILLSNERCSPYNANAVRSSLGTVFELPFVSDSLEAIATFLKNQQIQIVTTRVDSETDYTHYDLAQPVALVLGSEANGVSTAWYDFPSITIPMNRSVDSLNISATAAVVAFEAQRQRKTN